MSAANLKDGIVCHVLENFGVGEFVSVLLLRNESNHIYVIQASADCTHTSKPDYMFFDTLQCVEAARKSSPLPIPPSVVTYIYRLVQMTEAEFDLEAFEDANPHFPRPIRPLGNSKSGPVLHAMQEGSHVKWLQELRSTTISESSSTDTAELSETPENIDHSRAASPDETCSPVTPVSPTFAPFSPIIDEESCCMWGSAKTSRTYFTSGAAFSALGFVCPELEQMTESLGDFKGRDSHNDGAQPDRQDSNTSVMDLAC